MNQLKEQATIQHVFEEVERQKNKTAVTGETWEIPASRYTSSKQLAAERKTIFQNFPTVVGSVAELEKAGDYFLHDYAEVPIMVIKGKDEKIRAFLNICRHRGVRLVEEKRGHIKRNIVCPYHAWSYDTAGCLKRVFHAEAFGDVNADSHSLIELDCQVRLGLIFVVPNPKLKGQYDIDVYLKEVTAITNGYGFENWVPFKRLIKTNPFNWKLGIEGGLEAYHFKIAHAKSLGPYVFDCGGIAFEDNKLHFATIYPKTAILKLKEIPKEQWNLRQYGNILIHIFPNTTFLIMEDHVMVLPMFPLDEKTNISESFLLIPKKAETEAEQQHFQMNYDIFWNTINEDNEMNILQQQSFNSYDDFNMKIGGYETLLLKFSNLVQEAIDGKLQLTDFQ